MNGGISLNAAAAAEAPAPRGKPSDNSKLKDAAGKFEAMLIAQMLKSARKTDSGGWSGESDLSTSSIMDLAEQQLADTLGAQGGLGLAQMVVTQLGPKT
jgi:Rod binding domain-containing protein